MAKKVRSVPRYAKKRGVVKKPSPSKRLVKKTKRSSA